MRLARPYVGWSWITPAGEAAGLRYFIGVIDATARSITPPCPPEHCTLGDKDEEVERGRLLKGAILADRRGGTDHAR
jgi:hypothetical protein